MANEELEVKQPEQTGSDPSPDEQAPQEPSEAEVKEPEDKLADGSSPKEEKIPYEKYKKVIDERNLAQEMLANKIKSYVSEPENIEAKEPQPNNQFGQQYLTEDQRVVAEWKKYIDDAKAEAIKEADKKFEIQRKLQFDEYELRELQKEKDFPVYAEAIKDFIKDNPHYSFRDAYDLIRVRTKGISEPEPEVSDEEIKRAETGKSIPSSKQKAAVVEDMFFATNPDGSYKYSVDELEGMLPKE